MYKSQAPKARTKASAPAEKKDSAHPQGGAFLWDSEGEDVELPLDQLTGLELAATQVLWLDLISPAEEELATAWQALGLPDKALQFLRGGDQPALIDCDGCFALRIVTVRDRPGVAFEGRVVHLVVRENLLVSVHPEPLEYVDELRERAGSQSDIGRLSSSSLAAALLDWQLSTYFAAVSRFEVVVEHLEDSILGGHNGDCLPELRRLRQSASRLRRMLAPHRVIFGSLSRPDFRPKEGIEPVEHFRSVDARFERAMDVVEGTRDAVMGSFELFSSQTALRTNQAMGALTFATVVLGVLAVVAGILGMNFHTEVFDHQAGFVWAVSTMIALALGALALGRWRGWV